MRNGDSYEIWDSYNYLGLADGKESTKFAIDGGATYCHASVRVNYI